MTRSRRGGMRGRLGFGHGLRPLPHRASCNAIARGVSTLCAAVLATGSLACTVVDVSPVAPDDLGSKAVCIERNPRVRVSDFLEVLEDAFRRHGIRTRVVEPPTGMGCEYLVTYVAYRGWDFAPFMDRAEVRITRIGETIGLASYEHHGGFGFNKWRSTRSKMDPVLDELLASYADASLRD